MYRVTCQQCGAAVITPDGNADALGCRCCTEDHSHQAAANDCHGAGHNHADAACPHPDDGKACLAVTPGPGIHPVTLEETDGEPCPGGHCGLGVDDCAVCRPVTVAYLGELGSPAGLALPAALIVSFMGLVLPLVLRFQVAFRMWLSLLALANMTDRPNIVTKFIQAMLTSSAAFTITPGAGGGSAFTITPPHKLRLMTAAGTNVTAGTELSATGYTAAGNTMGATAFGAPSAGVATNSNPVTWTAGAAWSAVLAIEVWDTSGTPQRLLQGTITSVTLANGNTLTFAAGSISADASAW